MHKLKTFETFSNTKLNSEMYPELNPSLKLDATTYVDDMLAGDKFPQLFDLLDRKMPTESSGDEFDAAFDEIRELSIAYFLKNPEEMQNREVDITNIKVDGGDGVPRTNNIGGSLNEDKYDKDFDFEGLDEDPDSVSVATLVEAIEELLDNTVNTSDAETRADFIRVYLQDETDDTNIIGLINDSDVYEFYLTYRSEIDDVLVSSNFFDDAPSELNVFGVYDYIVYSTKQAVKNIISNM
jgi:hypothetical protein